MANQKYVEILKQGVEVWNRWRKENPVIKPDLSDADLSRSNLSYANLSGANLSNANLSNANLSYADLSNANLSGANLIRANLSNANLSYADLSDATLSSATLSNATLSSATLSYTQLQGSDLENAVLFVTIWVGIDFRGVRNLDKVVHLSPSYVSFETLFNEVNKDVPEIFWRGCGVDDETLQHMKDRSWEPIQFYSCFISYSHKDEDFARRLFERTRSAGLRVWYAPEEMKGGEKLHVQIDQAIQKHDRLLLVLSEHSMNSEWVKTEIYNARQREIKENRRILFPLALAPFSKIKEWKFFDTDTGKDLAREIREYFIPDFTDWKSHDVFESSSERLLRDLKKDMAK